MSLLLIDNYDSFTYNLVQYFQILDHDVIVFEHDKITIDDIKIMQPDAIIISPGPNTPKQAGISMKVIHTFYQNYPILGVCLGHQCIGEAFGAKITQSNQIMHGKTSLIHHKKTKLFKDIPTPFKATRYHSLCIKDDTLPTEFNLDAWTEDGTIMAISHRQYPIFGVQFHPEAILTEHGLVLIKNFCSFVSVR